MGKKNNITFYTFSRKPLADGWEVSEFNEDAEMRVISVEHLEAGLSIWNFHLGFGLCTTARKLFHIFQTVFVNYIQPFPHQYERTHLSYRPTLRMKSHRRSPIAEHISIYLCVCPHCSALCSRSLPSDQNSVGVMLHKQLKNILEWCSALCKN